MGLPGESEGDDTRHGCVRGCVFVQSCWCVFSVSMLAVAVNMDRAWEPAALRRSDSHPPASFSPFVSECLECRVL